MQFSSRLYGSFVGALAVDSVTTNRTVTAPNAAMLQGKFNGFLIGGRYETGAELGWITPYLALTDQYFRSPGYQETALSGSSTFALAYGDQGDNQANVELGARQRLDLPLDRFWVLKLSDRVAWLHDMSGTPSADAAFQALPNSTFTNYGAKLARDGLLFSLGADMQGRSGFGLNVHVDSLMSGNEQTYTGMAGLNYAW